MGTVGYMSPEQVRGEVADHRSDIFAFGAILYEMLSGKRAFQGNSAVETMNAILQEEPPPLAEIDSSILPGLERVVRHCLEKNPERRYQSAQDLAFNLEVLSAPSDSRPDPFDSGCGPVEAPRVARLARGSHPLSCGDSLCGGLFPPHTHRSARHALHRSPTGEDELCDPSLSISPDGRHLAFRATDASGKSLLWVRPLDSLSAQPLPGSDEGAYPFWSPDSRFIGIFCPGKAQKDGTLRRSAANAVRSARPVGAARGTVTG